MYGIFLVGTAGSGKSTLAFTLTEWLRNQKQNVALVNLDPGVRRVPYQPDVDVREWISVYDIMDRYDLGPNGALIASSDLMALQLDEISKSIEKTGGDIIIVDTPGQIELFAFRSSGSYIVSSLPFSSKCTIFLHDSIYVSDPLNLISTVFLSSAVYARFLMPQISILTKIDLLSREKVGEIISWYEDTDFLISSLKKYLDGDKFLLGSELARGIPKLGFSPTPIPLSSLTLEGFIDLYAEVTRILAGGEEPRE